MVQHTSSVVAGPVMVDGGITSASSNVKVHLNQFAVLVKSDPGGSPQDGLNYAHLDTGDDDRMPLRASEDGYAFISGLNVRTRGNPRWRGAEAV